MAAVTLGRFAFGWSGGPPRRWSGRSVWVFLAPGRFAAKTPDHEGWLSLDSLVRIDTFQWVTRVLAGKIFSSAFSVGLEAPEREPAVLAYGGAGLFTGQA